VGNNRTLARFRYSILISFENDVRSFCYTPPRREFVAITDQDRRRVSNVFSFLMTAFEVKARSLFAYREYQSSAIDIQIVILLSFEITRDRFLRTRDAQECHCAVRARARGLR
jgi:hypothetical protein